MVINNIKCMFAQEQLMEYEESETEVENTRGSLKSLEMGEGRKSGGEDSDSGEHGGEPKKVGGGRDGGCEPV